MMLNALRQLDLLHREMDRFFNSNSGVPTGEFPLINVYTSDDAVTIAAELPGISPDDLDVSTKQNTITIRGSRYRTPLKDKEVYLQKELGEGSFTRSFSLPFAIEDKKVKANYKNGILTIYLPRAESDKPRKINVCAG